VVWCVVCKSFCFIRVVCGGVLWCVVVWCGGVYWCVVHVVYVVIIGIMV
jgi:hypothetical protein